MKTCSLAKVRRKKYWKDSEWYFSALAGPLYRFIGLRIAGRNRYKYLKDGKDFLIPHTIVPLLEFQLRAGDDDLANSRTPTS